jgi:hypothetical protein
MCGGGSAPPTAARSWWGCAPVLTDLDWAKGGNKGVAQKRKGIFTAGQSRRLTSGGKAEAPVDSDLETKARLTQRKLTVCSTHARTQTRPGDCPNRAP